MDQSAIIGAVVLTLLTIYGYARMISSGINQKKLKAFLPHATVVDLRSSEDYRNGHFSGALNISVEKLSKSAKRLGNKSSPLIIYCSSPARTRQATRILRAMGYSKVINGGTLTQIEGISTK